MTIYRLQSFAPTHKIIAVQRISAASDAEAVSLARDLVNSASAVASFDLWERERPIHGVAPTMRRKTRWRGSQNVPRPG
jgi:hypothetical protein